MSTALTTDEVRDTGPTMGSDPDMTSGPDMGSDSDMVTVAFPRVLWNDLEELVLETDLLSDSERMEALASIATDLGVAGIRVPRS